MFITTFLSQHYLIDNGQSNRVPSVYVSAVWRHSSGETHSANLSRELPEVQTFDEKGNQMFNVWVHRFNLIILSRQTPIKSTTVCSFYKTGKKTRDHKKLFRNSKCRRVDTPVFTASLKKKYFERKTKKGLSWFYLVVKQHLRICIKLKTMKS